MVSLNDDYKQYYNYLTSIILNENDDCDENEHLFQVWTVELEFFFSCCCSSSYSILLFLQNTTNEKVNRWRFDSQSKTTATCTVYIKFFYTSGLFLVFIK